METLESYKEGTVLLVDKPLNWTSFQVVNKIRWLIKQQFNIKKIKVGHAGTLDPLATGLLILCTGKYTKKIETYQAQLKEYTGTFTLGATTPSYDLESEIDQKFDISEISQEDILKNIQKFLGEIHQQPPIFSALKKNGKRLYEYAREGSKIDIPSRPVTIKEFQITKIELPCVEFRIVCGKGTYIRSLAYDFGRSLNNGAYLSSLRRTKIGEFRVEDAIDIFEVEKLIKS